MDNKTKEAIKQIHAELRQLQVTLAGRPAEMPVDGSRSTPPADGVPAPDGAPRKGECAVTYTVRERSGGAGAKKGLARCYSEAQLARVTDEQAAAVGYALASPQKVGLLRALAGKASESAAQLGQATHLSTGSLYHHLRELMRAELVSQAGRNRYVLTERGDRTLLVLLALAVEDK